MYIHVLLCETRDPKTAYMYNCIAVRGCATTTGRGEAQPKFNSGNYPGFLIIEEVFNFGTRGSEAEPSPKIEHFLLSSSPKLVAEFQAHRAMLRRPGVPILFNTYFHKY